MFAGKKLFAVASLVYCQCWIFQTMASGFAMVHPQALFCRSDFVFRFVPVSVTKPGRSKRSFFWGPKELYKVEVERFYKGEKIAMLYEMNETKPDADDVFSDARKIEAVMIPGMHYNRGIIKHKSYIFFGRRNKYLEELPKKYLEINEYTTMLESKMSKIMRRGIRKKYAKGCASNCTVLTVNPNQNQSGTDVSTKDICQWLVPAKTTHCQKEHQFCIRSRNDGQCYWKETKAYKNCIKYNTSGMP